MPGEPATICQRSLHLLGWPSIEATQARPGKLALELQGRQCLFDRRGEQIHVHKETDADESRNQPAKIDRGPF